jgi:hypothetical protein
VKVAKTVKNLPTFGSFRKVRYYLIIPKSGDGHQCTDYLPLTSFVRHSADILIVLPFAFLLLMA